MPHSPAEIARRARRHVVAERVAVLSTLSLDPATAGFPFGSVTPYALDGARRPLILISDIAQHTRNLKADPRASLFVKAALARGDPQANWRVTLVGRMVKIEDVDERTDADARYVLRFPESASHFDAHGFSYWRMDFTRIRFIGGFGDIHWIEPDVFLREGSSDGPE